MSEMQPGMEEAIGKLIQAGVSDEFIAGTLDVAISDVRAIHQDLAPKTLSADELANKVQMLLARALDHAFFTMEWGSGAEQNSIMRAFLIPLTKAAVGEGSDEFADVRSQLAELMKSQRAIPAGAVQTLPAIDIPVIPQHIMDLDKR